MREIGMASGVKIGAQLMTRDARDTLDFEHPFRRHAPPLRDRAVRDPKFGGHANAEATVSVEKVPDVDHAGIVSTTYIEEQARMLVALGGGFSAVRQNASMAKVKPRFKSGPPRHFIRQWRKYRGFTLEGLAEAVGVTHSAIQQLETGRTNYTQPMLEALADALACSAADLIIRNPLDDEAPWSLLEVWQKADAEKRRQMVRVIQAFDDEAQADGTNG